MEKNKMPIPLTSWRNNPVKERFLINLYGRLPRDLELWIVLYDAKTKELLVRDPLRIIDASIQPEINIEIPNYFLVEFYAGKKLEQSIAGDNKNYS